MEREQLIASNNSPEIDLTEPPTVISYEVMVQTAEKLIRQDPDWFGHQIDPDKLDKTIRSSAQNISTYVWNQFRKHYITMHINFNHISECHLTAIKNQEGEIIGYEPESLISFINTLNLGDKTGRMEPWLTARHIPLINYLRQELQRYFPEQH